ncbi:MAG: AmmeMemoRadiSam system radical SAM enzyme, partial [Armatimonadota bacterium]
PTPPETLLKAYRMAKEKLRHVYVGNVDLPEARDTECAGCGRLLVSRQGLKGKIVGLDTQGRCAGCGDDANLRF